MEVGRGEAPEERCAPPRREPPSTKSAKVFGFFLWRPWRLVAYRLAEAVRVVTGVRDECLAPGVGKELVGNDHFVPLPRRERDVDRAAFGIDDGVELC